MARKIVVEFRYFDRSACSRCRATDENVEKTVRNLRDALAEEGVKVELKTTRLPASRLAESNSVLVNGRDAEELVNGRTGARATACRGCGGPLRVQGVLLPREKVPPDSEGDAARGNPESSGKKISKNAFFAAT